MVMSRNITVLMHAKQLQAASQLSAQMAQINTSANMFQPGQDPDKLFQGEAENLDVLEHWSVLDFVADRLLAVP